MAGIRCLGWVLAALSLIGACPAGAQSEGLLDVLSGDETISSVNSIGTSVNSIANERLLAHLTAYYRAYGRVRLGRESRLANGVAWRLQTDVRTGLSAPRLTWMPDRNSLERANALFEAMHGEWLAQYDYKDIEWRSRAFYIWNDQPLPPLGGPPYFGQVKVAVTYASSRFVSYIDLAQEHKATSFWLLVTGRVLDLEQRQVWEATACRGKEDGFWFGDLLDLCDGEASRRVFALWAGKVDEAMNAARRRGDELSVQCAESMRPLDWTRYGISLYLTPGGLAVFNRHWSPNSAKFCAFYDITVNPIVIPYRELEPFMKPGPLRDELLR